MPLIDFHTHCVDASTAAIQVLTLDTSGLPVAMPTFGSTVGFDSGSSVSVKSLDGYFADLPSSVYFSVGVHPWKADQVSLSEDSFWEVLCRVLSHPRVLFVGEIGLDKLSEVPFNQQLFCFEHQLRLAAELHKPVVLHNVKATDEILALHKKYADSVPAWIIHGFRGNASQAAQWLRHGFDLSFGLRYQLSALQSCPLHRLFLETDTEASTTVGETFGASTAYEASQSFGVSRSNAMEKASISIESHYQHIATALNMPLSDLSSVIEKHFTELL